jgi:RNA polymerase sigma factor (sigma-70 family)
LATQSDERLVALVHAGHEPAFEALVHRYRRPLLRYCRRLCPSEGRAEEVLQQALMNAWVALRRDCEVREVRAWLYRVAHNAAINAMRTERAMVAGPISVGDDCGGEQATEIAVAGAPSLDQVLALRDALTGVAELPQMQREVIVRTAVGGHSHAEIASALGITAAAVRGLLYRARATLRDGVTALTPAPLLAWATGTGGARSSSDRVAELVAGGSAPLAGLAVKGTAVAITAGVAITGSVIARDEAANKAPHLWTAGSSAELASAPGSGASDPSSVLAAATTGLQASLTDRASRGDGNARLAGRMVSKPFATSPPIVNVRSTQGDGLQPVSTTLPGSQTGEARSYSEPAAAEGAKRHHGPPGIGGAGTRAQSGGGAGMSAHGNGSAGTPAHGNGGAGTPAHGNGGAGTPAHGNGGAGTLAQGHGEGDGGGRSHGRAGQGSHGVGSQQGGGQESHGAQQGPGYRVGQRSSDGRESREESGQASEHGAGNEKGAGHGLQKGSGGQEATPHGGQELGEQSGEEPKGGGLGHLDRGEPQGS